MTVYILVDSVNTDLSLRNLVLFYESTQTPDQGLSFDYILSQVNSRMSHSIVHIYVGPNIMCNRTKSIDRLKVLMIQDTVNTVLSFTYLVLVLYI